MPLIICDLLGIGSCLLRYPPRGGVAGMIEHLSHVILYRAPGTRPGRRQPVDRIAGYWPVAKRSSELKRQK
jgi:hypothetical protein